MRHSKRSLEGELFIDHTASPGMPEGRPEGFAITAQPGKVFESPVITCSHCHYTVVLNPDRQRPREYCAKCDKYICEECAALMYITLECRNMDRRMDDLYEAIEKYGTPSPLLAL